MRIPLCSFPHDQTNVCAVFLGRKFRFSPLQIRVDIDSLGEQILPSFYAEDRTNCMNQERRREALARGLRMIRADIERERKGKAGVENLARALQETPKFGSEDSQSDVREKLRHMKSMLTYFEASRYADTVLTEMTDFCRMGWVK